MAFNYPFPVSYMAPTGPYPQYYMPNMPYQQAMAPVAQAPQQQSSMICAWVQGEAGGKAFPVNPGQNAFLFDSEGDVFYIKSADASGMPTLRTFEYHEVIQPQQSNDAPSQQFTTDDLVKRSEYEELKRELDELRAKTSAFENSQSKSGQNNNRSNNR